MKILQYSFIFLISTLLAATATASEQAVKQKMEEYWGVFTESRLPQVAKLMYPGDLQDMKSYILPVFAKASKSDVQQVREMAGVFFEGMPSDDWKSLSPEEVFVRFNSLITAVNPGLYESLRGTRLTINDIHFGSSTEATAYYSVELGGQQVSDTERLAEHNGTWYLRTKEPPKDTASKFKQLFER